MLMPAFVFANDQSFSGVWSFREGVAGQGKPYSTFVIRIGENKSGSISGPCCFVTRNGNRVDCGSDGENNLVDVLKIMKIRCVLVFIRFFVR